MVPPLIGAFRRRAVALVTESDAQGFGLDERSPARIEGCLLRSLSGPLL